MTLEITVIKIIDKKIEHLQKAIQFIDAACEDDLLSISIKLGKKIDLLNKRKKSLEQDLENKKE